MENGTGNWHLKGGVLSCRRVGIWESVEAVGEGGGFAIGSEGVGYKTPSSNLIGDREGKANFSLLKGRFGQPKKRLTRVLLSLR